MKKQYFSDSQVVSIFTSSIFRKLPQATCLHRQAFSVILLTLFSSAFVQAQVVSDFSTNDDGWKVVDPINGTVASVYSSAGGNPGGFISYGTLVSGPPFYFIAPAKFLGNKSRSYNQNLTLDLKVSFAGTDNSVSDIILSSGANTIIYQLPTKPSSTGWSSYSIPLNEAQWHLGAPAGAAPSQVQMKQVLSNIQTFEIRFKYFTGNTFTYTGQLDNVVLNSSTSGTPPTITSFTPSSALAGTSVVISGTNFNTTAAQNIVYFKNIKATIINATSTQLTVKVPTSAVFGPITVENLGAGLQATSVQSFTPLFDNNKDFGGQVIPASLSRGYATIVPMSSAASNSFGNMDKGDLDGDGWIDLVATETSTGKIYAFRNLGTGGTVSAASFAAAFTLPSLSGVPGGGASLSQLTLKDIDSDGKLDVAAIVNGNFTGFFAVFLNTSSSGSISFSAPQFFAYYSAPTSAYMHVADLDGDGRVELIATTGTSPGNVWICQNQSSPGVVDFAYGFQISAATTSGYSGISAGDLNGDGKPELVAPGYNATTLSVYQNNSTLGTISMGAPFTIPAVVAYTNQLAIADLDADNKLDMVWSTYNSQYVYMTKNNYSSGAFDATAFGSTIQIANTLSNPLGISVGDINSDNKPDVVLSGYTDLAVLQNVGTSGNLSASSFLPTTLFQASTSQSTYVFGLAPGLADLDGDNKPEAFFITSGSSLPAGFAGIYIFHNESYPVPQVTSTSPTSAQTGSTVALNGDLMFTGNNTPMIRLNKVLAPISGTATNALTSVTLPTGAISGKFSVTNHGLTTSSSVFKSVFGTNRTITLSSFLPSVDFALAVGTVQDVLDIADFNDDGKMDVLINDANGAGIFQNATINGQSITASSYSKFATTYPGGSGGVALDIDGDGKTDVNNSSTIFQNTGAGSTISFATGIYSAANNFTSAATGDFNKDGKTDLATVNSAATIQLYENRSSRGTFINNGTISTFVSTAIALTKPTSGGGIVAADFDGDGYDDLASTNSTAGNFSVFRNLGAFGPISAASFSAAANIPTGSQPSGLTANDFDGDGKVDIAITLFNQLYVSVYLNTSTAGSISFAAPVNLVSVNKGYTLDSQDLDGDGLAEIVAIFRPNPGPGSFTVFKNNSTGGSINFASGVNYALVRNPQALNIVDVNADQKPDILIVASGGSTTPVNALMVFQNNMTAPVITITTQPTSTYFVCTGTSSTITTAASGTTNIAYQWQILNTTTNVYTDLTNTGGNSNVAAATLTINTSGNFGAGTYRCSVNGDYVATVYTNTVSFTVNAAPAAPTVTDAAGCSGTTIQLVASGGTNGQYKWYTDATGATVITGAVNDTYTTPALTATTTYYVSSSNGACQSTLTPVTATIKTSGCDSNGNGNGTSPIINTTVLTTAIGGKITLDLKKQITVTNGGTLDLTSLQVVSQPASGALASIDTKGILTVDYAARAFAGIEMVGIKACDLNGNCATQQFTLEVGSDITIYNALSPQGANPIFVIQNINVLPDTKDNKVSIFDRWENEVWQGTNYDNTAVVFSGVSDGGNDLPSGVYFYKIEFASGRKALTGFISLRR